MASSVYLSLNEKPRVILDVMRRVESEALQANQSWNWGCAISLLLLALGVPFVLFDLVLGYNLLTFSLVALLLWALAIALGVYTLISGRAKVEKAKFEAASAIIFNLRDDVAKNGRITGWLDLTGPRQRSKIARTARSASGRTKTYYHDPWLQFKARLADGNVLRLAVIEQQKVKRGVVAERSMRLKGKIVFNPQTYQMRPFTPSEKAGELPPGTMVNLDHGVLEVVTALSPTRPDAWQVLNTLKAVYARLEPVGLESHVGRPTPSDSPVVSDSVPPPQATA
jgi:hypothetical protein